MKNQLSIIFSYILFFKSVSECSQLEISKLESVNFIYDKFYKILFSKINYFSKSEFNFVDLIYWDDLFCIEWEKIFLYYYCLF